MFGHLLRNDEFISMLIEGNIKGKNQEWRIANKYLLNRFLHFQYYHALDRFSRFY